MRLSSGKFSSCEVLLLWGPPPVRSSSHEVIFMWYHLPLRSSSSEVIFLWDHLPVWSSSCEVVFLWGHLPVMLSSCEVVFQLGCLSMRIAYEQSFTGAGMCVFGINILQQNEWQCKNLSTQFSLHTSPGCTCCSAWEIFLVLTLPQLTGMCCTFSKDSSITSGRLSCSSCTTSPWIQRSWPTSTPPCGSPNGTETCQLKGPREQLPREQLSSEQEPLFYSPSSLQVLNLVLSSMLVVAVSQISCFLLSLACSHQLEWKLLNGACSPEQCRSYPTC